MSLGTLGAVVGDFVAVYDSYHHSPFYLDTRPYAHLNTILSVFGSMALAFGGSVVIPTIQRDLVHPERMPTIILVVLVLVVLAYFVIGTLGYVQYGCVAPQNLLLSMTGKGNERLAMIAFLIHILLAYAVYINPFLFLLEQKVFGWHEQVAPDQHLPTVVARKYQSLETPKVTVLAKKGERLSRTTPRVCGDAEVTNESPEEQVGGDSGLTSRTTPRVCMDLGQLPGVGQSPPNFVSSQKTLESIKDWTLTRRVRSVVLRTTVVTVQVFVAMILQENFEHISDFAGASCLTISGIILPLWIYLRIFPQSISQSAKRGIYLVMVTAAILGIYTSVIYLQKIMDTPFHLDFLNPKAKDDSEESFGDLEDEFCQAQHVSRRLP